MTALGDRGLVGERMTALAAVVVNYANVSDTVACVDSLRASTIPMRVFVVDNGSPRDDATVLKERFGPSATVVRVDSNLGFGAGANVGIRAALVDGARFVWLVNNDTLVPPSSAAHLLEVGNAYPRVGILSPVVLGSEAEDWASDVWFAGGWLDLSRAHSEHIQVIANADPFALLSTEFITGAAMFVRAEVFRSIGLFDESFFMFWEDVEFCLRARRAGWELAVTPGATIRHRVHGSIGRGAWSYLMNRNGRDVAGRYASPGELVWLVLVTVRRSLRWLPAALRGDRDARASLRGSLEGMVRMVRRAMGRLVGTGSSRLLLPRAGPRAAGERRRARLLGSAPDAGRSDSVGMNALSGSHEATEVDRRPVIEPTHRGSSDA